jgi:hypothetical protein
MLWRAPSALASGRWATLLSACKQGEGWAGCYGCLCKSLHATAHATAHASACLIPRSCLSSVVQPMHAQQNCSATYRPPKRAVTTRVACLSGKLAQHSQLEA